LKILIFGLPGSGKSTLAEPFAKEISGVWINADKVREEANDWDFTLEGRMRQAQRMRNLADEVVASGGITVADFVCPTQKAREEFGADFTVWMDTIEEGRYEDTNKMFEKPKHVDYHVAKWFNDTPAQLAQVLKRFRDKK
jgi:adenylylsulfate kinase